VSSVPHEFPGGQRTGSSADALKAEGVICPLGVQSIESQVEGQANHDVHQGISSGVSGFWDLRSGVHTERVVLPYLHYGRTPILARSAAIASSRVPRPARYGSQFSSSGAFNRSNGSRTLDELSFQMSSASTVRT
jgi:hypothetical protein